MAGLDALCATDAAVARAEALVPLAPVAVQQGEILFREGDRLTEKQVAAWDALHARPLR